MAEAAAERKTISQAEFAAMVKVSRSAVSQAAEKGRFAPTSITPQGFLIYPDALQDWFDNADSRRFGPGVTNAFGLRPGDPVAPADDDADPAAEADAPDHIQAKPGTVAFEKIETARIRRRMLEGELAKSEGRVRTVEEIHAASFDLARALRRTLQAIPTWTEELIPLKSDPEKIRGFLKDRARALADGIAADLKKLIASPDDAADDPDADV